MIKFKILSVLLLITFCVIGCQKDQKETVKVEKFEVLDDLFTKYNVVSINNQELLDLSKGKKNEVFTLDLKLEEKPNWVFSVQFYDFYSEDYKAYESDLNGNWIEVQRTNRSDAFHGQSSDLESRALFVMEDNHFTGTVIEGNNEFFIEPLSEFVKGADPNLYVYYDISADITGQSTACGNMDQDETFIKGDESSSTTLRSSGNCKELSIAYVADYELLQKNNGDVDYTRYYVENMLKYGSYRYWGYNNYPLYFKIYGSYVMTNNSNPPTTSTSIGTSLNQFKAWGNDGNIQVRDCNLLYTGREYISPSGFNYYGIAKVSTVCQSDQDGYKAFGLCVSKLSGVSSHVQSKVTAHEVGHTLGCGHTSGTNHDFMAQGKHSSKDMSTITWNALDNYIGANNTCMPSKPCVNFID